jgi:hypothetical protein
MNRLIFVFLIILNSIQVVVSQEWIRIFGIQNHAKGYKVVESYDHGYIIGGHYRHNNYYWQYGWLLKTDVNGELLWDIKLGNENGEYASFIFGIDDTPDGGLIICGSTQQFYNDDGFMMKLDACGQKEWCNIYKSPGNNDYSIKVYALSEGGYIMNFAYWGYDLANKRIWLFKLDEGGNPVWQNLYGTDTSYINEHAYDMIITPDSGYLLTGENHHEIDTLPGYYHRHPFFIKVNKDGQEEWEHTYWPESGFGNGIAKTSTFDLQGNIFAGGYRGNVAEPCLIKISASGEPLGHNMLMQNTWGGGANTINFLQDSTLIIGGSYNPFSADTCYTKVWKTDKNGTILLENENLPVICNGMSSSVVTFDNKVVFVGTNTYTSPTNFDIIMFKLNSELEYDSIYTQPFIYDYLCPEPIISDTIEMDCDIITDVEEQINKLVPSLLIKPNPAVYEVTITLPDYYKTETKRNGITSTKIRYMSQQETILDVYDIFGRQTFIMIIPQGQKEINIDVSEWTKGMHMVRLLVGNEYISTGKILIL